MENYNKKIDNIVEEYNKSKQNMENALRQSIRKEEQLNDELYKKEKYINEIKNDVENLGIEKNQLKYLNEQNKKEYNIEYSDINSITIENEKLKNEVSNWQGKVKIIELKTQKTIISKDKEIETMKKELESNNINLTKIKEEKNFEIDKLKNEINKNKNNINILIKKNESIESENSEIKNNILNLQTNKN